MDSGGIHTLPGEKPCLIVNISAFSPCNLEAAFCSIQSEFFILVATAKMGPFLYRHAYKCMLPLCVSESFDGHGGDG
jgi:hypothetical protein